MLYIPPKIQYVIDRLCENGFEAYIVGGCVRDMLLGKTPYDFDVTTSATPEEVISLFEKTVPTGIKHGTVTVIIEKENIEVTTFRTEKGYSDNRHPESVSFVSTLKEDLARRDFTVNALAYNNAGLVDCFGGTDDLENKILRAMGEPKKRFSEDALRILRLFRFSSALGFCCEEKTLKAALELSKNLQAISRERIFTELCKAVTGKSCENLKPLIECGALYFLGITKTPDFGKIKKCSNKNLALFTFLYLAANDVISVLTELKSSNAIKNYCKTLLELLKHPFPENKAEIKQLLAISNERIFTDYLTLNNALFDTDIALQKALLKEITTNNEPYLIEHLCLNGEQLKSLGISGKKIGKTLKLLQEHIILFPEENTIEKLTEYIKNDG